MALGGDLQNVNLGDIFQTLSMNRQEGTLVVHSGTKEKRFYFSTEGVSLISGRTIPGFSLGKLLVGKRKITEEDLELCLDRQRRTGEILGQILVDLGFCQPEDIREVVRYHAAEELYEIFTWKEGGFDFLEGTDTSAFDRPSPYAGVRFDPKWVVIEAARRIDEWGLIRGSVPSDDNIFTRTGREGPELDLERWGDDLANVYELIDGTRTVREIFEANYLSPFDTAKVLLELIRAELIRSCTFAELTSAAWDLIEKRDLKKAAGVLSRAHNLEPRDTQVLEHLADCHEQIDQKRMAGECLVKLGRIHFESGRPQQATKILEKAERCDPGSPDTQLLLMKLHLERGESEAAADRAIEGVRILCERQEFERATEICREALASAPDHVGLRIAMTNAYLGTGQREVALEELEEIASTLEESRDYRRLTEIYKKILQLDSSRREYLRRLQEIQSGRGVRQKKLIRVGAIAGGALLLLIVSLVLITGGTDAAEQLATAWEKFHEGDLGGARLLATEVATSDPESETAIEARKLLAEIQRKEAGSSGSKDLAERQLEETIESLYRPARELIGMGEYDKGLSRLLELADFFETATFARLAEQLGGTHAETLRNEYRKSIQTHLDSYADALDATVSQAELSLKSLTELKLTKADQEHIQQANEKAKILMESTNPDSHRDNCITVDRIEIRLQGGKSRNTKRLEKATDQLRDIHKEAVGFYHRTRAALLREKIIAEFTTAMLTLKELKNKGNLEAVKEVCNGFLERCDKLRAEQPDHVYEPVVKELLGTDGLDLERKMRAELDSAGRVLEQIAEAEAMIEEERYEEANSLLRKLLRESLYINFQDLVNLALLVRTRPAGAEVRFSWGGNDPRVVGVTNEDGVLVRYPPYGTTVVTLSRKSFETVRITIEDFTDEYEATPIVNLRKVPEWSRTEGGAAESSPRLVGDVLLVPNRDGHLRGFDTANGETELDFDTGLLPGLASLRATRGGTVYLATREPLLIAYDLKTRKVRWKFATENSLMTSPAVAGSLVVVSDEPGNVYAVKSGVQVWRTTLEGRVLGDPCVSGRKVLFGTTEGHVYCFDAPTGKEVWRKNVGGPVYASLATDGQGRLLVGTETSELVALSLTDGRELWRFKGDNAVRGTPAVDAGIIYVTSLGGSVYRVAAETGNEVDSIKLPGKSSLDSGVALGRYAYYVVTTRGVLFAISPPRGVVWTYETGSRVRSSPVVAGGRIYLSTEGGETFCFLE